MGRKPWKSRREWLEIVKNVTKQGQTVHNATRWALNASKQEAKSAKWCKKGSGIWKQLEIVRNRLKMEQNGQNESKMRVFEFLSIYEVWIHI